MLLDGDFDTCKICRQCQALDWWLGQNTDCGCRAYTELHEAVRCAAYELNLDWLDPEGDEIVPVPNWLEIAFEISEAKSEAIARTDKAAASGYRAKYRLEELFKNGQN